MNKKRTIALVGVLSTVVLGAVAWKAVMLDPSMIVMAQNIFGLVAKDETEGQEFMHLQNDYPSHYGFINSSGMCVIPPAYEKTSSFSEGLCAVCVNKKWGFINKRGEMVIKPSYNKVRNFSEGLAAVKLGTVWGYIDRVGNYLVKPSKWSDARSFKNGVAIVSAGNKKAIIYRSGEYICRDLDSIGPLSDGFYCIKKSGLYGFLRQDGRAFIEPKYENASNFSEGLAAVSQGNKWGYIDDSFKCVIAHQFASADDFHSGLAVVSEAGKYGIIDKAGSFRLKPIYHYLSAIPPIDTTVKGGVNSVRSGAAALSDNGTAPTESATSSPGLGVSTILVDGVAYSSSDSSGKDASKLSKTVGAAVGFVPVKLSDGADLTPVIAHQLWGFAGAGGALSIPAQYADVHLFSEGLASVAMFDHPDEVAQRVKGIENDAKLHAEYERKVAAEEKRAEDEQKAFIKSEAKRRGVTPAVVAAEIKAKEAEEMENQE